MEENRRVPRWLVAKCDKCGVPTDLDIRGDFNKKIVVEPAEGWYISRESIVCPSCIERDNNAHCFLVSLEGKAIYLDKVTNGYIKRSSGSLKINIDDIVYSNNLGDAIKEINRYAMLAKKRGGLSKGYADALDFLNNCLDKANSTGTPIDVVFLAEGFTVYTPDKKFMPFEKEVKVNEQPEREDTYQLVISTKEREVQLIRVSELYKFADEELNFPDLDVLVYSTCSLQDAFISYMKVYKPAWENGLLRGRLKFVMDLLNNWIIQAIHEGISIEELLRRKGYNLILSKSKIARPHAHTLKALAKATSALDILDTIHKQVGIDFKKKNEEAIDSQRALLERELTAKSISFSECESVWDIIKSITFTSERDTQLQFIAQDLTVALRDRGLASEVRITETDGKVIIEESNCPSHVGLPSNWIKLFTWGEIEKLGFIDYDKPLLVSDLKIEIQCTDSKNLIKVMKLIRGNIQILPAQIKTKLMLIERSSETSVTLRVFGYAPRSLYDVLTYKRME